VFPSDSPEHATGPGAVVWSVAPGCPGGEGARVSRIGVGEAPDAPTIPRTASGQRISMSGPLALAGAPHGQVMIAGASPANANDPLLIEGSADGPFAALASVGDSGAPLALATAYLGDVALASPPARGRRGCGVCVRVQRHYSRGFGAARSAGGSPRALALALDYRSDALVAWAQGEAIYAHALPASGTTHPIERLARAGTEVRIAALLSDDNRGMVAWSEQDDGQTSVYLDRSRTGVRFGSPELLERFSDPDGLSSPAASPALVRLSSESVMIAWAGSADGRWVLRTAAVDARGVGPVATIAARGGDALLSDLATGPDGDAVVLWTEPQLTAAGRPDLRSQAIFAARGIDAYPDRTIFRAPEQVAPPGPNEDATVAVDPDSDRAVAVWLGANARIEYSIRSTVAGP